MTAYRPGRARLAGLVYVLLHVLCDRSLISVLSSIACRQLMFHVAVFCGCLLTVALPFTCDFETDAICDMQLSTASNLDWTRRIGRASEQQTGPPGAQSGSYYMLVDASVSAAAGHRAMLVLITVI